MVAGRGRGWGWRGAFFLACGRSAGADFAGSLWGRGSWASSCLRGTLKTTSKLLDALRPCYLRSRCVMVPLGKVIALNMVLIVGSHGDRGSFSLGVLLMLLADFVKPPEPPWVAVT